MLRHLPKFFMQLYFRERSADQDDQPGSDLVHETIKRQQSLRRSGASGEQLGEDEQDEMDEERKQLIESLNAKAT